MNIFLRELRSNQKSTVIWALSLIAGAVLFLSMFPAFNQDVTASQTVIGGLPLAVRQALNISVKTFFTIYGFFAYLFTFITLAGAIQAMNLGISITSKEDSGKTADFLLTKPISRNKVVHSKLLAALFLLLMTNVFFSAGTLLAAKIVSPNIFSSKIFLLISLSLLLIQLVFLAMGTFISVIARKVKSTISFSLPTVFTFFIIGTLGAVLGNTNDRYIDPFKFYDPTYIINNGHYETTYLIIETIFIVVAISASYIIYNKKDIRAAS